MVLSERFHMGVRDLWYYSKRFCTGVRDGYYSKSSVWVLETRGVIRKVLLCETPRKSNFLKKGKMVISVQIQKFSRYRMTKRNSPLESSRKI